MFTVKHVQSFPPSPPIENLYEGDRITVHPDHGNRGALEIRQGETFVAGLWGGTAYVMNSAGKTVAVHHLPVKVADAAVHHHPDCAWLTRDLRCDCGTIDHFDRKTKAGTTPASSVA